ncbi:unnamed protein product [Calypogeia fissa]
MPQRAPRLYRTVDDEKEKEKQNETKAVVEGTSFVEDIKERKTWWLEWAGRGSDEGVSGSSLLALNFLGDCHLGRPFVVCGLPHWLILSIPAFSVHLVHSLTVTAVGCAAAGKWEAFPSEA